MGWRGRQRDTCLSSVPPKEVIVKMHNNYEGFKECLDISLRTERRELLFVIPDNLAEYARKSLEFVFYNSTIDVKLMINRAEKQNKEGPNKRQLVREETVPVKRGQRSFADLVKTVKGNVDVEDLGVKVKALKKTVGGDLILKVEAGQDKANKLKNAIQLGIDGIQASVKSTDKTVFITDLDVTTTREEVEDALRTVVGGKVEIRQLRPTRDGNQVATIGLFRSAAKTQVAKGKIKIGWVACRIREKISLIRCYRCLEYGHMRGECSGVDRSTCCLKCGKEGHVATACKDPPYCRRCETPDHREDTMRCPHFRKLVIGRLLKRVKAARLGLE